MTRFLFWKLIQLQQAILTAKLGIKNAQFLVEDVNPIFKGNSRMIAYELFSYDEKNGYEFIGILPERRKDPKRITKESVLNWGRMVLGDNAQGKKIFFKSIKIDDITGKGFEAHLLTGD